MSESNMADVASEVYDETYRKSQYKNAGVPSSQPDKKTTRKQQQQ